MCDQLLQAAAILVGGPLPVAQALAKRCILGEDAELPQIPVECFQAVDEYRPWVGQVPERIERQHRLVREGRQGGFHVRTQLQRCRNPVGLRFIRIGTEPVLLAVVVYLAQQGQTIEQVAQGRVTSQAVVIVIVTHCLEIRLQGEGRRIVRLAQGA